MEDLHLDHRVREKINFIQLVALKTYLQRIHSFMLHFVTPAVSNKLIHVPLLQGDEENEK